VIPDKLCRELVGFIGSRHLTLEYMYTCDQVKEMFGVDLEKNYTGYSHTGYKDDNKSDSPNYVKDDETDVKAEDKDTGLTCVWKYYDKLSGLCYYLCDGYDKFLRKPAAPDIFVEDFWPVYALTFNAGKRGRTVFPPSEFPLRISQQQDYSAPRQGQREH